MRTNQILLFILAIIIIIILVQRIDIQKENQTIKLKNAENDFFMVENINSEENVYRIVILGDSVVETDCPNVIELETMLNENNNLTQTFNVIKAGKAGKSIKELSLNLKVIRKEINYDAIFILTGWNEQWYNTYNNPCIHAGCYDDKEFGMMLLNKTNNKNNIIRYLSSHGYNYWQNKNAKECLKLFVDDKEQFLQGLNHYNTSIYRVSIKEYQTLMSKIINEEQSVGNEVFLVVPPEGLTNNKIPKNAYESCLFLDEESFYEIHNLYIQEMIKLSNKYSTRLLRLDEKFKENPNYKEEYFYDSFNDPVHPDKEGKKVCTQAVYDEIISSFS